MNRKHIVIGCSPTPISEEPNFYLQLLQAGFGIAQ
jgi:hypothetical protein